MGPSYRAHKVETRLPHRRRPVGRRVAEPARAGVLQPVEHLIGVILLNRDYSTALWKVSAVPNVPKSEAGEGRAGPTASEGHEKNRALSVVAACRGSAFTSGLNLCRGLSEKHAGCPLLPVDYVVDLPVLFRLSAAIPRPSKTC